jgi:transcriptional regulator with XRE-family HTH domain
LGTRARKQIQPVFGPVKAFGQALREMRKGRKISQEQLAFDSGFDRTYVSMVERGVRSPTIRSLVRLAEVLQVPSSEIVLRMEALLKNAKPQRKAVG